MRKIVRKYKIGNKGVKIAVVSDLHDMPCESVINAVNGYQFFKEATKIAHVVYSFGNHNHNLSDIDKEIISETGAVILDNANQIVCAKNGYSLNIGGLSSKADWKWYKKYQNEESLPPKILMCHYPEYTNKIPKKYRSNFSLIVCGHTHGGQWKIFGRGLYATGQGLFPRFDSGKFGNIIVSAGVSNPVPYPRFGNPCEIVLRKLSPNSRLL